MRREFVHAKLAALRVSPEVSRLVASLYERQCCRQLTHRGLSAGRFRGAGGLTQGSQGSPPWSLLMQDPLWVGIAAELRAPGRGLTLFGVPVPPQGWSDDWFIASARDAALQPVLTVFGAICVDLGISCKPEALRAFLRSSRREFDSLALTAWDPFRGGSTRAPLSSSKMTRPPGS